MNDFDPVDFGYPPLVPDPFQEQMRDFASMNSMLDQCQISVEQPPLPGDWRFQDRQGRVLANLELHTELEPVPPAPINRANMQSNQLSDILSMLESQIEGTVIPGPAQISEIPSVAPIKPGGYRRPDPSLDDAGAFRLYHESSQNVRHRIRGNRSGLRRTEEEEYCFERQERVTREDCQAGCSHWDPESMDCKYFEDWEKDHPPEEA